VADPGPVRAAIAKALEVSLLVPGWNSGPVNVAGTWYIYRAYLSASGAIHVGTYFPW